MRLINGEVETTLEPALTALNMRLRDDYTRETASGIKRWNKQIEKAGISYELKLPNVTFNRKIGVFSEIETSPEGLILDHKIFEERKDEWLPSQDDGEFVASLMHAEVRPGYYAGWIAPPKMGIDNKSGDFEFVQIQ